MPSHLDPGAERRARLAAARLYLICDSRPGGRELPDVLRAAIAGGVDIVQLRDKQLGDDELAALARAAATLCRQLGVLFVVNDRPEVALAAHADGVHVGQQDMAVTQVRELVGTDLLVGLSTHEPAEIDAAGAAGRAAAATSDAGGGASDASGAAGRAVGAARSIRSVSGNGGPAGDNPARVDYIGVGPVHPTPTKPGRPATGLELVRYASTHATLPFFAIGGIHAGNLAAAIAAGARRVAVVRAVAEAPDPERSARELRAMLARADERSCFPISAA